jgi:hypothetical protein
MAECKKRFIIKANPLTQVGPTGPMGPAGPPGDAGIELPLSSDDVVYGEQTLTEVLDDLLYQALTINSFGGATTTYERGQVLTSLGVTWTYNKAIQTQTITGTGVTSPTLTVADRSKTLTLASISSDTTITLTADDDVTDARAAKTATMTLRWYDGVFWGVGAIPSPYNSAFILGLSNKNLRSSRQGSFSMNVGASQYGFIAMPVSMGAASFKTNGFNGGLSLEATISFTNAYGAVVDYNIYRTVNHSLGLTAFEIL